MHGYKWPINCTRTRSTDVTTVPDTGAGALGETVSGGITVAVKQVLLEEGLTLATAGKKLNKDVPSLTTMRAELIGHFKPCMTDIYLHI